MKNPPAIVFLGPSLPAGEAARLFPAASLRGPARQGDVLRALRDRPKAIALIDGVFESAPSVWHQELRIALAEGIHVLGAASMGALRAVELAPFGMIGVGAIYRAYDEGLLTDDADVALLHAAAEHEFRSLTVPLVNVVAAAEHAVVHGALSISEARALLRAARGLHYQDRHWNGILARLRWSAARKQRFEQFRRAHPQDAKAADARECLVATRKLCESGAAGNVSPRSTFSVWARRAWLAQQGPPPDADADHGLRTLLLADWCRSLGLLPPAARVAAFEERAAGLDLDPGLRRRSSEALALEELVLRRPELLLAHAPSLEEGRWVDAIRRRPARARR
jgi:hypothetical protein